ncbi:MAG: hypothetical protein GF401_09295 [Chitinivibrionales bacterium]|nr:hypothetical protein [Chitinivibrionales bacterium]
MPELPDVEVFRQYFNNVALKKRVDKVDISADRILEDISARSFQKRVGHCRFMASSRHGKHLFVQTDNGGAVVLHFGMTGYLQLVKNDEEQPKHTSVAFRFDDKSLLAYSCTRLLGKVTWTGDVDEYIKKEKLGPDALDLSVDDLNEILNQSRSGAKSTLMDQSKLAGLGNIYSDEILYQSGIHPEYPAKELNKKEIKKLYNTMHRIIDVAVRHGAGSDGFPRRWLLPHRNKGDKCPRCDSEIKKISAAGRSSYICPKCQKNDAANKKGT